MKGLIEYIDLLKEIKTNHHDTSYNEKYDVIDLTILLECQRKFQNEYNHPEYMIYGNIFESHGIFSNEREFASFISNVIFNCAKSYKDKTFMFACNQIDELKNNFVEIIYINFSDNIDNSETIASYDERNSKERFNGEKFDFININISNEIDRKIISSKIQHELKHAYQDFNLLVNNESLYKKSLQSLLNKFNFEADDITVERNFKYVMYILEKYEQSAYISELDNIISNAKTNNIQDGFNEIYKSNIYEKVKWFYLLMNYGTNINKQEIFDLYNKLNDCNYTYSRIDSILKNSINKFWKKFINHMYQCICDNVKKYANRIDIDFDYHVKLMIK